MDRSKYCKHFFEKVTQRKLLWNYFKIGLAVPEAKIFKELLKKFHFITMATRVTGGITFCEQFLQRTSQGTFPRSLVQIGPAVWEEKMFKVTTHDGHRTTLKAPLEHVVLRWAKNCRSLRRKISLFVDRQIHRWTDLAEDHLYHQFGL